MRSLQGQGVGAWHEAIPVSDKYAMEPSEFRLASCMRLGQAMPFGKWIDHCDCGCQLDEEGYHLLTYASTVVDLCGHITESCLYGVNVSTTC